MNVEGSDIRSFILENRWLPGCDEVTFLAAGEYNENYTVRSGERKYVFRINHGSQLGLANQIEYEYNVLQAVLPSGVTPEPFRYQLAPAEFSGGVLLMSFIAGDPFDYRHDLEKAADVFAAIHSLPAENSLILQENPIGAIAEESKTLLCRYPDHPLTDEYAALIDYREKILALADEHQRDFENDRLCIVNTEVNSGNFIVREGRAWLVDWEKAVVSSRYQDLGHFLVPTTTLWKSDYSCTPEDRLRFLSAYRKSFPEAPSLDELSAKTALLEKTILLRAMSWCYMAYYEYTQTDRAIKNNFTYNKIRTYMDEMAWFLR